MNAHSWLKTAQTSIDRLDAELILAHALKTDRTFLHAHPETEISEKTLSVINKFLARREDHEPLAYILGEKEFYGRLFKVTKDTLIPRPATEDLIDLAKKILSNSKNPSILDVGTGSGCIAVTLSLELPNSKITAVDISENALKIAKQNAKSLTNNVVTFFKSDLYKNSKIAHKKFDLICANLPYVNPDWTWNSKGLKHEPDTALYAKNNGLDLIQKLLDETPDHLTKTGSILIEADPTQHANIAKYARNLNLSHISTAGLILHLGRISS